MKSNIQPLILFDIDGTLTRNKPGISYAILSEVFNKIYNVQLKPEDIGSLAGKTDREIHKAIANKVGISAEIMESNIEQSLKALADTTAQFANAESIIPLQGGKELLDALELSFKPTLALLTGNVRESAYHKLKPFDLHTYFPFGAFGDDHEDRRELPPIALHRAKNALSHSDFSFSKTIIIGDAPGDVHCAKAHGITSICVATGKNTSEELQTAGADLVLDNLHDTHHILAILQSFLIND